jgi:hypothetical protein
LCDRRRRVDAARLGVCVGRTVHGLRPGRHDDRRAAKVLVASQVQRRRLVESPRLPPPFRVTCSDAGRHGSGTAWPRVSYARRVTIAELGEEMGVDVEDVTVMAMALQVRIDDELTWEQPADLRDVLKAKLRDRYRG